MPLLFFCGIMKSVLQKQWPSGSFRVTQEYTSSQANYTHWQHIRNVVKKYIIVIIIFNQRHHLISQAYFSFVPCSFLVQHYIFGHQSVLSVECLEYIKSPLVSLYHSIHLTFVLAMERYERYQNMSNIIWENNTNTNITRRL